jgi:hypothetical protein
LATCELVLSGVYLSIFFVSLLFLAQMLRDKTLWGWQRLKCLTFARKNSKELACYWSFLFQVVEGHKKKANLLLSPHANLLFPMAHEMVSKMIL